MLWLKRRVPGTLRDREPLFSYSHRVLQPRGILVSDSGHGQLRRWHDVSETYFILREMVTTGEFSQARRVFGEGSKGADVERAFALTGRVLEREEARPLK